MSESGSIQKIDFIERFVEVFGKRSYKNPVYGYLSAHCILGQVLKNVKLYIGANYIDPRLSFFIMQPSGTGKSVGWEIIKPVALKAGIAADEVDEATDAALIGTQDEMETFDPQGRTKTVEYTKVEGKLATAEILHYDEGETLMQRSEHARNTLNYFEKALNPIGSASNTLSKRLGHVEFEIHPRCSLIVTSYPVQDVVETILNKGFFQRIVLFPREVNVDERKFVEQVRAGKLGRREFTETDVNELGEALMQIRAKYGEYEFKLEGEQAENLTHIVNAKIEELFKAVENCHPRIQEIMYTFVPRYDNLMYVFAFHHMCNRWADSLEPIDVNYAFDKVHNLFKALIVWIEESVNFLKMNQKELHYMGSIKQLYSLALNEPECIKNCPEGYVYQIELMKICMKNWHVSNSTVKHYFEKFIGLGTLQQKTNENKVVFLKVKS